MSRLRDFIFGYKFMTGAEKEDTVEPTVHINQDFISPGNRRKSTWLLELSPNLDSMIY